MGFDVSYTGPAPTRNCASRRWPTSVTSAVLCLMRAHATAKHESSTGSTRGAFLFTTCASQPDMHGRMLPAPWEPDRDGV